ncbi:UDP-N-acetylmuramoyl-L-alanyl-D-glutamate--2,6-diaminopimelate ligase [Anaeropeptidivorans aminofermentans]|uniref:UDP-N-acetylmuramoyl-L-alanyl-D-glutamate--2, 6-diaminopimelate ligase n=1 Tax=Anaeropeptidivorans aminofermentans TaxID=2934315 RepID=UPI002024F1C6|nr:UDP-N-acetylmuramoyl-L-alanyl-D-glutamate--2,6-diaminopimelate ligase [Anaeropeptidivorans aminofermentans]
MKLFDILKDVEYKLIQGEDKEIRTIETDSRKASDNSLFICISGFHVDGHKFIQNAYDKGAVAFVIEKDLEEYIPDATYIKVQNSREAWSFMAQSFYKNPSEKFRLIGITGTNGKTSSTYFLEAILKEYGRKTGIIGTIGVTAMGEPVDIKFDTSTTPDPMELQHIFSHMAEKGIDDVIMEVTSHALELHKVAGIHFDIGEFTNLTQDHLDLHGSMEAYKEAKGKLFKACDISIINSDDAYSLYMQECTAGKIITYGIEKPADIKAYNVKYYNNGIKFDVSINGDAVEFSIPIPGRFTVYNALGVITCSIAMDIPIDIIKRALENLHGVPGRIQSVPNDKGIGVYVDYSHTPDSLENIICAVREFTKGKVITIFGCGGDRDRTKRPIMGEISGKLSDFSIITSDNPRTEIPSQILDDIEPGVKKAEGNYIKIVDRKEAIFYGIKMAEKGDSVIIAGKGHENYQIFADKTIHFDDWEIANEALKD